MCELILNWPEKMNHFDVMQQKKIKGIVWGINRCFTAPMVGLFGDIVLIPNETSCDLYVQAFKMHVLQGFVAKDYPQVLDDLPKYYKSLFFVGGLNPPFNIYPKLSDNYKDAKGKASRYQIFLKAWNIKPAELLIIDSDRLALNAAHFLGCHTITVKNRKKKPKGLHPLDKFDELRQPQYSNQCSLCKKLVLSPSNIYWGYRRHGMRCFCRDCL